MKMGLRRAISAAKLNGKGISPYAFRHTFATQVLAKTSNLRAVQTLLGHSRSTMTERYAHVLNEQLREAIDTLQLKVRNVSCRGRDMRSKNKWNCDISKSGNFTLQSLRKAHKVLHKKMPQEFYKPPILIVSREQANYIRKFKADQAASSKPSE